MPDDADVEEAAAAAARRSFSNMGQICIAVNRILVADRAHDAFIEALAAETVEIKLGHGVAPGVLCGPMLAETGRARVAGHVEDAVARGGKLLAGGARCASSGLERGFFFEPTLIDAAPDDALVMREESYGPIAAIRRVHDDEEALAVANALPFGLAAYVYSRDLERAWRFAEKLESGAVGVNVNDTSELQAPFGGWKLSGVGSELGPEGLMALRQTKHIKMRVRDRSGRRRVFARKSSQTPQCLYRRAPPSARREVLFTANHLYTQCEMYDDHRFRLNGPEFGWPRTCRTFSLPKYPIVGNQ